MSSKKRRNTWHKLTINTKKANVSLGNSSVLEDEIGILAATDFDACSVGLDKITFYSWRHSTALVNGTDLLETPSFTTDATVSLHVKAQDIVWVKHAPNQPYWPAYVSSASRNTAYVFYISRTRFSSKTPTHKKSKNEIVRYTAGSLQGMKEQGFNYYKKMSLWDNYDNFHNAISLAKTYLNLKEHNYFTTVENIHDFFNSDLQKFEPLEYFTPPATPHMPHRHRSNMQLQSPKEKDCFFDQRLSSSLPVFSQKKRNLRPHLSPPIERDSFSERELPKKRKLEVRGCCSKDFRTPKMKTMERGQQRHSLANFDHLASQVLSFILEGSCNGHIEKVLESHFPSTRMKLFEENKMTPQERRMWRINNFDEYFVDEDQQGNVMRHLRELLVKNQERNKTKMTIKRVLQLLFDVLYPEAIIWAIAKVRKISYKVAEQVYRKGNDKPKDLNDDCFTRTLSPQERRKYMRSLSLFDGLCLGNKTL